MSFFRDPCACPTPSRIARCSTRYAMRRYDSVATDTSRAIDRNVDGKVPVRKATDDAHRIARAEAVPLEEFCIRRQQNSHACGLATADIHHREETWLKLRRRAASRFEVARILDTPGAAETRMCLTSLIARRSYVAPLGRVWAARQRPEHQPAPWTTAHESAVAGHRNSLVLQGCSHNPQALIFAVTNEVLHLPRVS